MKEEILSSNEWENGNGNGNGNVSVNGQWGLAQEVDSIYMELGEIAKSLDKIRQRLANITKAASGREVTGKELSLPGASFPGASLPGSPLLGASFPGPSLPGSSLPGLSESQMDERIFHPSFDMRKLKQAISDLGILPSERNRWCVVFLVLRENSIIASNASEQEFIHWARDVFGVASGDFRHCLNGAKALPTWEWTEALVASKYISLASQLRSWASSPDCLLKRDRHGEAFYFDSHHKWCKMKA